MSLLERIERIWNENRSNIEYSLRGWLKQLPQHNRKPYKIFRCPPSLKVYTSVSKGNLNFSLRCMGQEVGEVKVEKGEVFLVLKKKHIKQNAEYFKVSDPGQGSYPWRSKDAGRFRKSFQKIPPNLLDGLQTGIPEHRIESRIIHEMLKKSRKKFQGTFRQIQPVTIGGVPLQWPLPISASSGEPKKGIGHIDILARRRFGGKVNLSLWELKAPDNYKNPLREGYIYAVTLLKILRDTPEGIYWYNVFGFKKNTTLPPQLTIEVVVAITCNQWGKMIKELTKYREEMPIDIGHDRIIFSIALYDEDSLEIDFRKNILCNS